MRCFFFFFSSRRRHTRYWRDWSSDVCSSDLQAGGERRGRRRRSCPQKRRGDRDRGRSEERRVGKECRSWTTRGEEKKKNRILIMRQPFISRHSTHFVSDKLFLTS